MKTADQKKSSTATKKAAAKTSTASPAIASTALELAWMEHEGELLIAPAAGTRSAVMELIDRIYSREALGGISHARIILRNRIFLSAEPSMSDHEVVKMAAKRMTAPVEIPAEVLKKFQAGEVLVPATNAPDFKSAYAAMNVRFQDEEEELELEDIPELLVSLLRNAHRSAQKYTSDRPISALLLGPENELLGVSWNSSAEIRTRHAEWNLCDALARGDFGGKVGGKIPAGSSLIVTLKPCRMCAARIWEMCEDPSEIEVVYLEPDNGPLAQGTMLEPESPARVRYLGMDHPLFDHELQSAWGAE